MQALENIWLAIPLVVAISLVYSATRHEALEDILRGAVRIVIWFGGFLVATGAVILLLDFCSG